MGSTYSMPSIAALHLDGGSSSSSKMELSTSNGLTSGSTESTRFSLTSGSSSLMMVLPPVVQDMLSHFFFVPAHEFNIGPDRVLRTVHLVHDERNQKVDKGINDQIDLLGSVGGSKLNP